jgi:hypothetical protein
MMRFLDHMVQCAAAEERTASLVINALLETTSTSPGNTKSHSDVSEISFKRNGPS